MTPTTLLVSLEKKKNQYFIRYKLGGAFKTHIPA